MTITGNLLSLSTVHVWKPVLYLPPTEETGEREGRRVEEERRMGEVGRGEEEMLISESDNTTNQSERLIVAQTLLL